MCKVSPRNNKFEDVLPQLRSSKQTKPEFHFSCNKKAFSSIRKRHKRVYFVQFWSVREQPRWAQLFLAGIQLRKRKKTLKGELEQLTEIYHKLHSFPRFFFQKNHF